MIKIDNLTGECQVKGSPDMLLFELSDLIREMKKAAPEGELDYYKGDISRCVEFALLTDEQQLVVLKEGGFKA